MCLALCTGADFKDLKKQVLNTLLQKNLHIEFMSSAYHVFHLSLNTDIYFKITTNVCRYTEMQSEIVSLHSYLFVLSAFTVNSLESWCPSTIMSENTVKIKIDLKILNKVEPRTFPPISLVLSKKSLQRTLTNLVFAIRDILP